MRPLILLKPGLVQSSVFDALNIPNGQVDLRARPFCADHNEVSSWLIYTGYVSEQFISN